MPRKMWYPAGPGTRRLGIAVHHHHGLGHYPWLAEPMVLVGHQYPRPNLCPAFIVAMTFHELMLPAFVAVVNLTQRRFRIWHVKFHILVPELSAPPLLALSGQSRHCTKLSASLIGRSG